MKPGTKLLADGKPYTEEQACDLFVQIVFGFRELHQINEPHMNVKSDNILLATTPAGDLIKVSGFGKVGVLENQQTKNVMQAENFYVAPEVEGGEVYGLSADIWGLAVMLYQMVTGKLPFDKLDRESLTAAAEAKAYIVEGGSPELNALLDCMFKTKESERPTVNQLLTHPRLQKNVAKYLASDLLKAEYAESCKQRTLIKDDTKELFKVVMTQDQIDKEFADYIADVAK